VDAIAPFLSHAAILAIAPFFSHAVIDDVPRFDSHAMVDSVARWMVVGVVRTTEHPPFHQLTQGGQQGTEFLGWKGSGISDSDPAHGEDIILLSPAPGR
jgi:hypothetical protein